MPIFCLIQIVLFFSCSQFTEFEKVENIDDCYIYNNHTYFYIKHKTNWYAAKDACSEAGAHLLIINDKAENDFIKQIIDDDTWLGLTDVQNEGFWQWVDNAVLLWSYWAEGEPNNGGVKIMPIIINKKTITGMIPIEEMNYILFVKHIEK
jgi:hypothetical protein